MLGESEGAVECSMTSRCNGAPDNEPLKTVRKVSGSLSAVGENLYRQSVPFASRDNCAGTGTEGIMSERIMMGSCYLHNAEYQ